MSTNWILGQPDSQQTPTKKCSNPDHNMPPKASEKKNKQEEEICIICDSIILEENEDDENQARDEAIFCEGLCQRWLHRKCAGLIFSKAQ